MTAFQEALTRYQKAGAANASDAALMAGYCKHCLQLAVGAVSPALVWDGAQKSGLTSRQLARMVADPRAVSDLQWI